MRAAVTAASALLAVAATDEARRTCAMETGYAGTKRPWFVMRYTTTDLTKLPEALLAQLGQGRYRQVAVGACAADADSTFSSFRVAVLLYP